MVPIENNGSLVAVAKEAFNAVTSPIISGTRSPQFAS
jgi:hypothetical protein